MSYKQIVDYVIVIVYDGLIGDFYKIWLFYKLDKMNVRFILLFNVCFVLICIIFGIVEIEYYCIYLQFFLKGLILMLLKISGFNL